MFRDSRAQVASPRMGVVGRFPSRYAIRDVDGSALIGFVAEDCQPGPSAEVCPEEVTVDTSECFDRIATRFVVIAHNEATGSRQWTNAYRTRIMTVMSFSP